MLGQIGDTSSRVLNEMNNVIMKLKEEEDKRKDFEGLMDNFKNTVDLHHTELAEIKMYNKQLDKIIEEFNSNKCGIEKFNDLRNKVLRKVEEFEVNNK